MKSVEECGDLITSIEGPFLCWVAYLVTLLFINFLRKMNRQAATIKEAATSKCIFCS